LLFCHDRQSSTFFVRVILHRIPWTKHAYEASVMCTTCVLLVQGRVQNPVHDFPNGTHIRKILLQICVIFLTNFFHNESYQFLWIWVCLI
jgi:hypothetical protein